QKRPKDQEDLVSACDLLGVEAENPPGGYPLPGCWSGKEREAVPEAAVAVHPHHLHTAPEKTVPSNHANLFHWLPKEHMCLLVYLVTVIHSMQAGYLEKVQKSRDKTLIPILSSFQVILLEHIITCRLVTGHKATALQEISQHTLPGLYCVSVNCMDSAKAQFTTALRLTSHQELWAFMVTN
ncbi:hypothetical protein EI555_000175, partial [Monodon monoceros]